MKFLEFDGTRDFPFYRHNPRISKSGWLVLLLSVPIAFIVYMAASSFSEIIGGLLFCLIMLIPLLYFSGWDYSLMFRKPTKNEIILAVLLFVGYMIYLVVIGQILDMSGLNSVSAHALSEDINLESMVGLIFTLMGEELLKFIPLMFFMRVIFKFSQNLKLAVVVSTALVLLGFGLLHYNPGFNTIASVLLLQGLGSLFEMYGYIKTKNLIVPYITHLLIDMSSFAILMVGI